MWVWLSSLKWRFFVKLCLVLVNAHSCLTIHCEFFTPRLFFGFHTLDCSLRNFYLFYFQGVNDWRQENQENIRRGKRIHAVRMKKKLRMAFENLVKLKSLRYGSLWARKDIIVFKIVLLVKSFLFLFLGWNICDGSEWHLDVKKFKFGSDC